MNLSPDQAGELFQRLGIPPGIGWHAVLQHVDRLAHGVPFTVRGIGSFPWELTAKGCWPATIDDARNAGARMTRTINMISHAQPPAVGDWLEYGWDVMQISGSADVARGLGGHVPEPMPAPPPAAQVHRLTPTERRLLERVSRQDGALLVIQVSASDSPATDRALGTLRRLRCVEIADHPTVYADRSTKHPAPALRLTDVGRVALSSGLAPLDGGGNA